MKKAIALSLAVMVMVVAGSAMAAMRGTNDVVKVSSETSALTAAQGARIEFEVKMDITRQWHIYAHGDSNFIGVDLTPAETFPLADLKVEYPKGHPGEFFGEKVTMIEGKEVLKVSAMVPADLAKGEYKLELSVTAQACDSKSCLAPADIPVTFVLTVE